jgi:hypothetical protein
VFLGHLLEQLAVRQHHRIAQLARQLLVPLFDGGELSQQ